MIHFFSPAKVNLFWRVLRKREDGFHEIAGLIQAIEWGDDLFFELSEKDHLTCSDPSLSTGRDNLIWKAVDLYRQKTGTSFHLRVHVEKKIPLMSGLGGGSSNAATTLFALHTFFHQSSLEDLKMWAAELGSDVPFFLSSGIASIFGRGELIQECAKLPLGSFFIAKPQEGLSTPLIYRHCIPHALSRRSPQEILAGFFASQPDFVNDLEEPAFRILPQLSHLKKDLLELGFKHVCMTGSGSAFFCFGDVKKPSLPGVTFIHTRPMYRSHESWYSKT